RAVPPLLAGVDATLVTAPVNVLRLSLHPGGLAPRIVNLPEWRAHLLARLRRDIDLSADAALIDLLDELEGYPGAAAGTGVAASRAPSAVVVPMRLRTDTATLSFISTTTVFGTPLDVTLSELALESFFPADAATAEA